LVKKANHIRDNWWAKLKFKTKVAIIHFDSVCNSKPMAEFKL